MINQEFKALGRKYQVLPTLGICYRELRGLNKAMSCREGLRSFCLSFISYLFESGQCERAVFSSAMTNRNANGEV